MPNLRAEFLLQVLIQQFRTSWRLQKFLSSILWKYGFRERTEMKVQLVLTFCDEQTQQSLFILVDQFQVAILSSEFIILVS